MKQIIEKWFYDYKNINQASKKIMRFSSNLMKKTIINNCFIISSSTIPFIENNISNARSFFFVNKLKLFIDFFLIQNDADNIEDFINQKKFLLSGLFFFFDKA